MVSSNKYLTVRKCGLLAAIITVTIWATFLLATRFAVTGNFTVEEVLILRLIPAAVVMVPFMFKFDMLPRGLAWPRALILMTGASAAFPYIVSSGLAHASASDGGVLAPGMLPFWTALVVYFFTGEYPGARRGLGLALIFSGAMLVGLWQVLVDSNSGTWKGHLMFLTGSGLFAVYSVIFRQSGISPMHGLVIGLFWGTLFAVPLLLLTGNVSFSKAEISDILVMAFIQSFIISILATVSFNYAVRLLGAAQTGAFGALTPILALLGGVVLLDELVTPVKAFGIGLVAFGIVLASGILSNPDK